MTRRLLAAALLAAATSCIPAAQGHTAPRTAGAAAPVRSASISPAARPTPAAARPLRAASPRLPLVLDGLMDWTPKRPAGARPRARGRIAAAAPFAVPEPASDSARRALACLTAAVYHEARSESAQGQRAVAQVVLNRARHFAYPSSVCGVVYQGSARRTGCQFTFTCDGSLRRPRDEAAWRRAEAVAREALDGRVEAQVGWATHYHAAYVQPYWSHSLEKVSEIGAHIFYRMPGKAGEAPAFVRRASSLEPRAFAAAPAPAPAPARAAAPRPAAAPPVSGARGSGDR